MSYRKEAATRVLYFSMAAMGSLVISGLITAIVAFVFWRADTHTQVQVCMYSFMALFAITCGASVYQIDKMLSKRFDKNP